TRSYGDWSSDVCSSDLVGAQHEGLGPGVHDPAPRDPRELPRGGRGHSDELGDPERLDDQSAFCGGAEDRQLEGARLARPVVDPRSEEHTSELQSPYELV